MVGALSALCPEKRSAIASVAFRGFIAGSFVCFITASIAGIYLFFSLQTALILMMIFLLL